MAEEKVTTQETPASPEIPKLSDEQRSALKARIVLKRADEQAKLVEYVEHLLLEQLNQLRKELQKESDNYRKELTDRLEKANSEALQKFEADFRKANTPPSQDDIRAMLDAEYIEFPVKIKLKGKTESLTLGELPSHVERKFLKLLKDRFQTRLSDFRKLLLEVASETDDNSRFFAFWNAVDPIADTLHETVALILTHYLDRTVTPEEIEKSLTFDRQLVIVRAQMECNRVRDFFSHVFRLTRG